MSISIDPQIRPVERVQDGRYSRVTLAEAQACLSGHNARPLSTEYWSHTPSARYRIVRGVTLEAEAL